MKIVQATPQQLFDYETLNGKRPFRDWLDKLDPSVAARIEARLNRVSLGNFGDVKSVGLGVIELRVAFGSGYRVYFAKYGKAIVVLLCGGDKSTQSEDIKNAKEFWTDFKRRNNA